MKKYFLNKHRKPNPYRKRLINSKDCKIKDNINIQNGKDIYNIYNLKMISIQTK